MHTQRELEKSLMVHCIAVAKHLRSRRFVTRDGT